MSLLKKVIGWKYFKDTLIVVGVVILGLVAVMATHFSDSAKSPFWWKFWSVAGVLCVVGWIVLWIAAKVNDRKE